jgi:hypothetical protein
MELKFFLEDLFNRDVDLVLADTLKDQIKPKIMQEVQYVEGIKTLSQTYSGCSGMHSGIHKRDDIQRIRTE